MRHNHRTLLTKRVIRAVSDYMSQIAEQEMEKHKEKEMEKEIEAGEDSLQRQLEAHLLARSPGCTHFSHRS
jgi:hypothetical protein